MVIISQISAEVKRFAKKTPIFFKHFVNLLVSGGKPAVFLIIIPFLVLNFSHIYDKMSNMIKETED